MSGFDTFVMVDWSARSTPSPAKPSADAIWTAVAGADGTETTYHRTRAAAADWLAALFEAERDAGRRVLAGFDFPFGYPRGFAARVAGRPEALALWEVLSEWIIDREDNANNRFEVAAKINAMFPGKGPFWGRPVRPEVAGLPDKGTERTGHGLPERRAVEDLVRRAQPCWKLYTTGSVGSQVLLGLPRLQALRARFGSDLAVWPFEGRQAPIVLAEVYPSLLDDVVTARMEAGAIKDEVQVRVLAEALRGLQAAGGLAQALNAAGGEALAEEAWILGVGAEDALRAAATGARLPNDCFALPPGVDWTPVDEALARLRDRLVPVTARDRVAVKAALGRVLAEDAVARRANPPAANAAVDGYGFAHGAVSGPPYDLPLAEGRAAAGAPFGGVVPAGYALRILTGAILPEGVDTIVLEEDVDLAEGRVRFAHALKPGANTRKAGEDVVAGAVALPAGRRLAPQDLALLSATGVTEVRAYRPLRVGVLSTGDEIGPAGAAEDPARTYDANRPMLLALAERWGYAPVDLGHVGDDRDALRARLVEGAARADVIVTSGGASAGDEDHVSALLKAEGDLASWRIAIKPGRPLALAMWRGVPVFGLPGNPVAAFVCSLVFARPALSVMAGAGWVAPLRMTVPAAFSKRKKPGRREYLRARLDPEGRAEVFRSEGSGRISGLSWAEGLVELSEEGREIGPGDPVVFLPYAGFGI